jgi:hypothetical protein
VNGCFITFWNWLVIETRVSPEHSADPVHIAAYLNIYYSEMKLETNSTESWL